MSNQAVIELIVATNKVSTRIVEIMSDGVIRMHVKSPPVEGKANTEIIRYLAKILRIPKNQISIMRGAGSKRKMIKIQGLDSKNIDFLLKESLSTHHK